MIRLFVIAVVLFVAAIVSAQTPSTPVKTPGTTVDVVGTTPLPGVNMDRNEVPAPVQAATASDIEKSGALDLSDFLNRNFAAVHINEMQDNPFQPDVNYRGYTASPLLGTPQGLSVYMDGVRLNQPFGDVVSWDLIPRVAISSTTLMPGSNPLFGLNTLGGALSLQTKDGRSNPGGRVTASIGGHARKALEFEYGGANAKGFSWYVAGNRFGEHGWRNNSRSDVRQEFGKFGWQRGKTDLKLTLAYANNVLAGNGLQEQRFLARDYASVYTKPDLTYNRSAFTNLNVQHTISSTLLLSGNVYYRDLRTRNFNADINDNSLDQSVYQPSAADRAALTAAGYTGFPTSGATVANTPFPFWRCIAQALQRDEPGEKCNGLLNQSHSTQHNFGTSGQLTWIGSTSGHPNQFTVGAGYDHSRVGFAQGSQLGYLNPDRTVTGVPAFGDGVTGGTVDGVPYDTRVDLRGFIHTQSVFATDTLTLAAPLHLTASGRYNRTTVHNRDLVRPGGVPGSLDSRNSYGRLNPSVGLTYDPSKTINLYVGYSEGSRAPTSIELGCADPNLPCKLPNAMAGDPPLKQVFARTWEGGLRAAVGGVNFSVGVFRADNHNDIQFVSSTQSGFGYFRNFGSTRREGVELGARGKVRMVTTGASYTFLAATYQSSETFNGSGNSSNDDGVIAVKPGNQIPLVPRHMAKVFADVQVTRALSFSVDAIAVSTALARGNENNRHQPDGSVYLGPGKSPGYAVVNLSSSYQLSKRVELVGLVNNLLNHRYYTAARLGATGFNDSGTFVARPLPSVGGNFPVVNATFLVPGAPALFRIETRFRF